MELFGEHLDSLTNVTFLDPLFNILLHAWPTIMGLVVEEGSLATSIGCRWIIVMEFKDGVSCGFREIDFAIKTPEILLFGPVELGLCPSFNMLKDRIFGFFACAL
jgi:hypothetical protein